MVLVVPSVVVAVVVGPVAAAATQDVALVEALLVGAGLEEALREAESPVAVVVLHVELVRPVAVVLPVEVVRSVEVVRPVEVVLPVVAGAAKVDVAAADSVLGMVVVAAVEEVVQFVAVVQRGAAAAAVVVVLLRVALAGQFPADTTDAETVAVVEVLLSLAAVAVVGIGGQVRAPWLAELVRPRVPPEQVVAGSTLHGVAGDPHWKHPMEQRQASLRFVANPMALAAVARVGSTKAFLLVPPDPQGSRRPGIRWVLPSAAPPQPDQVFLLQVRQLPLRQRQRVSPTLSYHLPRCSSTVVHWLDQNTQSSQGGGATLLPPLVLR